MTESDDAKLKQEESSFPVEVDAAAVTFEILPTGELQTIISRPEGENIAQISRMPDMVYEQLLELGIINHD